MKSFLLLLTFPFVTMAQQLELKKDRQPLLDFRIERKATSQKISAATERSVLTRVFRRYLTDQNQCNSQFSSTDTQEPLVAARKAGQIVPSITGTVTGSFTGPGKNETLYVIFVGECFASHADNFGTRRVAIFSGQQLVADVDVDFKQNIERKTDLNSDGIDELLMTSGYTNQGTTTEMAALFSFQSGRAKVAHDFGVVYEDSCASGFASSRINASVLYLSDVFPGRMPKLTSENYVASCRRVKRWRLAANQHK